MQFFALAALFATAMAVPAASAGGICGSGLLYSSPLCCTTDVLGVADLDCKVPNEYPSDMNSFKSICAASGKSAQCCSIPVAGQSLLCTKPAGQ